MLKNYIQQHNSYQEIIGFDYSSILFEYHYADKDLANVINMFNNVGILISQSQFVSGCFSGAILKSVHLDSQKPAAVFDFNFDSLLDKDIFLAHFNAAIPFLLEECRTLHSDKIAYPDFFKKSLLFTQLSNDLDVKPEKHFKKKI